MSGDADARRAVLLLARAGDRRGGGRGAPVGRLAPAQEEVGRRGVRLRRSAHDRRQPTLLETAAIETLAIENSISRNRALAAMAATGGKLIELGDLAERVAALEAAAHRPTTDDDPFVD